VRLLIGDEVFRVKETTNSAQRKDLIAVGILGFLMLQLLGLIWCSDESRAQVGDGVEEAEGTAVGKGAKGAGEKQHLLAPGPASASVSAAVGTNDTNQRGGEEGASGSDSEEEYKDADGGHSRDAYIV
jgi:hypothetical protein